VTYWYRLITTFAAQRISHNGYGVGLVTKFKQTQRRCFRSR